MLLGEREFPDGVAVLLEAPLVVLVDELQTAFPDVPVGQGDQPIVLDEVEHVQLETLVLFAPSLSSVMRYRCWSCVPAGSASESRILERLELS